MTGQVRPQRQLLATVDVLELHSLRWGPLRQLFPGFVEEIELGRYLKKLLRTSDNRAVAIEPHREANGQTSTHVLDVYRLEKFEPRG